MAQWEGFSVSVRCGSPLGCYQGTILAADGASITLTKPFRNGFPYPKAQVTLKASDIKSLEIISGRNASETAHSTVPLGAGKRRVPRATVGESLQGLQGLPAPVPPVAVPVPVVQAPVAAKTKPVKSKPIDIQGSRPVRNNTHAGSYGASGSTPKTRAQPGGGGDKARRRNEACFGSAALESVDDDFDFEGNLALFDKEALWQQMRPDVVRVAAARDELARDGKLRHDQNVLRGRAPDTAPVAVPAPCRGVVDYVTDGGVRIPTVSAALRARLWSGLGREPHAAPTAAALLARAAADVALRLVGGTRRLDPRNAHQRPMVGVVAGAGAAAAAAVTAARLLTAHTVDTYVLPTDDGSCSRVAAALSTYLGSGGRVLGSGAARPHADLLLLAVHDPEAGAGQHRNTQQILEWAARFRGALVVLEPGGDDCPLWSSVLLAARAVLCAMLPPALPTPAPRLLLANIAPPPQLFTSLGVTYRPPFGAASVLQLHLADDDD